VRTLLRPRSEALVESTHWSATGTAQSPRRKSRNHRLTQIDTDNKVRFMGQNIIDGSGKWSTLAVLSFILSLPSSLFLLPFWYPGFSEMIYPNMTLKISAIIVSALFCFPAFFMSNRALRQIKVDPALKGRFLAEIATVISGWDMIFIVIYISVSL